MYQYILLPIDGSDISLRAADAGIALAAKLGARVHALHVVVPLPTVPFLDEIIAASNVEYVDGAREVGNRYLDEVCARAKAAGVACQSSLESDATPQRAIVAKARSLGCDLIVMGCNGWRGLDRLLLGSATQHVIVHGGIPVLVEH